MSIYSMTGFGTASVSKSCEAGSEITATVELRSVNNRFLDLTFKLPFSLQNLEKEFSTKLREVLSRGKVGVFVRIEKVETETAGSMIDPGRFESLVAQYKAALAAVGLENLDRAEQLEVCLRVLDRRDILGEVEERPMTEVEETLSREALLGAIRDLQEMRLAEGANLQRELLELLAQVASLVEKIELRVPLVVAGAEQRLHARLDSLMTSVELDQGRLEQEVAILVDRVDVREEITRLSSHIEQFRALLEVGGGRKMEFLLQELGREVNTIGSKSQDAEVTSLVVESKAVLEKMREQVLNLE